MKLGKYKITTRKQKQRLAIVIGAGVLILLVVIAMIGLMICGCLYLHEHLSADSDAGLAAAAAAITDGDAAADSSGSDAAEPDACVILDPGHGGSDGGTIGLLDGQEIIEKEIAFTVTQKVRTILENNNIEVLLTHDEDTDLGLKARTAFANETGADRFVSIHCNAYEEDRSICGMECYYEKDEAASQALAEAIFQQAEDSGRIATRDLRTDMMYVVRFTDMPATLVELGYLSNTAECRKLADSSYQDLLAQTIADGILQDLGLGRKKTEA
ncbi:MAG: N-acetylmuramoyl-L-alanine amidase [Firmicutes bacterium]|nr:N-acetylmuramoyl-L-alanine amidase [Bacillota bacterium]